MNRPNWIGMMFQSKSATDLEKFVYFLATAASSKIGPCRKLNVCQRSNWAPKFKKYEPSRKRVSDKVNFTLVFSKTFLSYYFFDEIWAKIETIMGKNKYILVFSSDILSKFFQFRNKPRFDLCIYGFREKFWLYKCHNFKSFQT